MRAASGVARVVPETASSRALRAHVWRRSVNRSFSRNRSVGLVVAGLVLALAVPAAAQQLTDARLQELMAQAREQIQARAEVQQPSVAQVPPQQVVNLTMDDAVKMALDQNIEISVQRLNPQIQDYAVVQAQAAYRPTLSSTVGNQSRRSQGTSQISGGQVVDSSTLTYNAGLQQSIRWTGGSVNVSFNNSRGDTNSNNTLLNPSYNSSLQLSYSQPLLRNRAIDSGRNSLLTSEITRRLADVTLRTVTTNTVANMRNAYWDLVYAVQALDASRASLALAEKLVEDNQVRVEVGTMAPIDVLQAQAEVANRRQSLVAAENTRRTTELTLKRYLVSSTQDPLWNASINPVDRPAAVTPQPIDLAAMIRTAIENRTDIITSRENLRSSELNLRYLRNQTLPGADLSASYTTQGSGGTQLTRSAALGGQVISTVPGGYVDALTILRKAKIPSWNVSVNFSYPLGQSSQEAGYARAKIQLQQSQAQLRALELTVATDLTNAVIQVQNYLEQVQAATASRELSQKKLEAEQSKFEVGMSTNYTVVQYQRDLRDAQNSELRAILNYRKALVSLEALQIVSR